MVKQINKKYKQKGGVNKVQAKKDFDTIIKPQILNIEHIKKGKIHPFDVKIILLYLRYIDYFDEKCSQEYNQLLHDAIYMPILIEPKRRNVNQNTKTNKIGYFNKLKKLHKSLKLRYTKKNTKKTNTKKNPGSKININGDMYIKVFNFIFNTNVGYIDVNEYRDNHNGVLNYYKWIVDYYSFLYKDQPEEEKYKIVRELINEFTFEHDLMIKVFKEEIHKYTDHYPIHSSLDKHTLPSELQKIIEDNEGKNLHKNNVKAQQHNTPIHEPTHEPAPKLTPTQPRRPSASKLTTHPVRIKTPSVRKVSVKNTYGRKPSAEKVSIRKQSTKKKSKSKVVFYTPPTSNKNSDSNNTFYSASSNTSTNSKNSFYSILNNNSKNTFYNASSK